MKFGLMIRRLTITEHDFRKAVTSLIIATKEYQEYVKLKQANEDFE